MISPNSGQIEAYLAQWNEATVAERHERRKELRDEGNKMLKAVNRIKNVVKRAHRQLGKSDKESADKLKALRALRSQLFETLQPIPEEFQAMGLQTEYDDTAHEPVFYSSSEEDTSDRPVKMKKSIFKKHRVEDMQLSQSGLELIAAFEGFGEEIYKVGGRGNDTIGFGHELKAGEKEKFEDGITEAQGLQLCEQDAQGALKEVKKYIKVPLTQYQLDTLVSYVYSAGPKEIGGGPNWRKNDRKETEFYKYIHAGDFVRACNEINIKTQGGIVLTGLETRREKERRLFLYGYEEIVEIVKIKKKKKNKAAKHREK